MLSLTASEERGIARRRLLVACSYVTCALIWGTTWYALRVCVQPGCGLAPNFAAAVRFLLAVALYIPVWIIFARKMRAPTLSEAAWLTLAGLFNGMYQVFIYSSECSISGGLASVISATSPLMVALLAMATKVEQVSRNTFIGFFVCLLGIILVGYDRLQVSTEQGWAVLLVVVACVFNSCANVTLKGRSTGLHPVISATIFLAATDIPVWIGSIVTGEKFLWPIPLEPLIGIIYLAVMSSIIAFSLYLYMIKHVSLMAVSTLPFMLPLIALIVDVFLEKRVTLSGQTWAGIGIVLSGVIFSVLCRGRAGDLSSSD